MTSLLWLWFSAKNALELKFKVQPCTEKIHYIIILRVENELLSCYVKRKMTTVTLSIVSRGKLQSKIVKQIQGIVQNTINISLIDCVKNKALHFLV